jgi:hypothetical protein
VMAKAGAIARYRTPLRSALRDGFIDKEGLVNGIYAHRGSFYSIRVWFRAIGRRSPSRISSTHAGKTS